MVRCSRCNKGACAEGYSADISQCNSIHYLCHGWTKIVNGGVGEKASEPKSDKSWVFLRDAEDGEEQDKDMTTYNYTDKR